MPFHEDDSKISAWLDGELSADEARSVETHVGQCESCGELAATFRRIRESLLLAAPAVEPDPGFLVRFRARRDETSVAPFWTWRQLALRLLPVAFAVLLLALGSVWIASKSEPALSATDMSLLEGEAIGSPTFFARTAPEPVLEIALEPFPGELP